MKQSFGDGSTAPPELALELVEQYRACCRLANMLRAQLTENMWFSIEADIAPNMTRFVIHYAESASFMDLANTVEVDFHPGMPITDSVWLDGIVEDIMTRIRDNESELIIPRCLDFVRIVDIDGNTVHEDGRAADIKRSRRTKS